MLFCDVHFCHGFTAMLLGSLKTPYKEIRRRILEVDAEHLTTGMLEQLIKYLPEPEQIKELGALKEEYDDLTEAEQFIVTVRNIEMFECKDQCGVEMKKNQN